MHGLINKMLDDPEYKEGGLDAYLGIIRCTRCGRRLYEATESGMGPTCARIARREAAAADFERRQMKLDFEGSLKQRLLSILRWLRS